MKPQSLYSVLIRPHASSSNDQNRELVLNWLLVGSLSLAAAAFLNALVNIAANRVYYLADRLIVIAVLIIVLSGLLVLSRLTHRHRSSSIILICLLFTAALAMVFEWGIINPVGILLFSLVIVMSSILLGARYGLLVVGVTVASLSILEVAKARDHLHPNLGWERQSSSPADVISFGSIFAVLALVTWLFNQQVEQALQRAERSERALRKERDRLEVTVARRTKALQAAQLEQI